MNPIDIIVVTFNRLSFTKRTINSIIERTRVPYRLIVVDNNSTDGTRDFLLELKESGTIEKLILMDKNVGLERALSRGLREVKSDLFVTTDNDCIAPDLKPCWLQQMVDLAYEYQNFAAFSLRPQVLIGVGSIFKTDTDLVSNNVCGGSYRIMWTEIVRRVGGWTKKFENDGRGNEEHDICGKLRSAGYKVGYTRNIFTYHLFGEDGTWGYNKDSNFKMGRHLEHSPQDQEYDPITCEPKIKSNQ